MEFDYRPRLHGLEFKHSEELFKIQEKIHKALDSYPNFDGIDFSGGRRGYININGHNKKIENYVFPEAVEVKEDFSDMNYATKRFIQLWKDYDNPEDIEDIKAYIDAGEVYC